VVKFSSTTFTALNLTNISLTSSKLDSELAAGEKLIKGKEIDWTSIKLLATDFNLCRQNKMHWKLIFIHFHYKMSDFNPRIELLQVMRVI
jgi:hypothetical protein